MVGKLPALALVICISILGYHTILGLPSDIVFPAYLILLLSLAFSLQYKKKIGKVYIVLWILCLITLVSLSYTLIPFNVPDGFPDANYVYQLLRIYEVRERIIMGVGTGMAFNYSFYPLFEAFVLLLSKISGIPSVLILRFFFIFSMIFFFITWVSIYKRLLNYMDAYVALIIVLASGHFSVFFTRPLHPTFALMFVSLLFLIWTIRSPTSNNIYNFVIIGIILSLSIALSHNTTGLLVGLVFLISLFLILLGKVLPYKPYRFNKVGIKREIFLVIFMVFAIYFIYNVLAATPFFEKAIITTLMKYLGLIFNRKITFHESVLGVRRKFNVVSPEETTILLKDIKDRLGLASLAFYLVLSGIFLLKRILGKRHGNTKAVTIHALLDLIAISFAFLILIGTLVWLPGIRDYYWRFYSYYFLFSAPAFASMISRIPKKSIKLAIIFIVLLSSFFWKPSISLGIDMPYELSDPRIGIDQGILLSTYIREKYEGLYISGTRFTLNVIGPFSEKWVKGVIYSETDFNRVLKMDIPIVLSPIELAIAGLNENIIHDFNIIYNSHQLFMLMC